MKTVIWDYNGTIINDVGISVKIENEMLEERGLKHDYSLADYLSLFDTPMEDYYRQIGYTFEDETFHDVGVEFYALYDKYFHECSIHEGVIDKLNESINKGFTNIILSSCEQNKLLEQCTKLNLSSYFEDILGVNNLISGSKVQNGLDWLQNHQTSGDECIYIGDTNADYFTAKALNIKQIYLVAKGHQSYERLKKLHKNTVKSIEEVLL